jgi:hypothetical protein
VPHARTVRRVEWVEFESAVVAAAGFDQREHVLEIVFVSGARYRYRLVSERVWREFRSASSAGRYFSEHIRDHFPAEWMP